MNIFTFLLVFYFGCGLIVVLATFVMNVFVNKLNKDKALSLSILFMTFPLWPLFAHKVFLWILRPNTIRCAWCGEDYERESEKIKEHVMRCTEHPMRKEMEALQLANNSLSETVWELMIKESGNDRRTSS